MLKNAFFNQFQSLIKTKPLKIFEKFQNRQLNCTLDFISILHGNVLHAIQRPGEGRKSGRICGKVVDYVCLRYYMCVGFARKTAGFSVLSLELQIVPACISMIHQSRSIVTAWQFANCESLFAHFAVCIQNKRHF